ncbi:uncharacterized protein LOC127729876 isoform X1 [Mytilus californianus]|uniref:uncharacterized protein LOC127729876 isoform X1 n=1 Tax=Mytilus californianus TaxID=6549 RepID=UPI0022466FE1|nr:uncharacterized protein LOC127729876 isoform X1 [Mytilus californianus]XP_052093768.1 uncharacterized protein LOC127729876 isoform X1 [Mytilus californianus]
MYEMSGKTDIESDAVPSEVPIGNGVEAVSSSAAGNFKGLYEDEQSKFVSKHFHHLPSCLKVACFDIFIIYHEDDYKEVDKFRLALSSIQLSNGRKINAVLYDGGELISLAGGELDNLEESFERCTYCFVYLSKVFVKDSWCKLMGQACLMETIYNDKKQWCVMPVLTAPRRQVKFKIPMGLNALKEIKYYPSNKLFDTIVQALINSRLNEREERELKLQHKRHSYLIEKVASDQSIDSIIHRRIPNLEKSIVKLNCSKETQPYQSDLDAATANLNNIDLETDGAYGGSSQDACYRSNRNIRSKYVDPTNLSNFWKRCDDKDLMRNYRILTKASYSVGIIRDPDGTGSGFRVGSKFFATARHVVYNIIATNNTIDINKLRSSRCYVEFEYISHNQIQNEKNVFHFTNIAYENVDLDVVILELKEERDKPFPPSISMISKIKKNNPVYIISHLAGLSQTADPRIELYQLKKDEVEKSKEWAASKGINVENEYCDIANTDKILFHCASGPGASGALGIMVDKRLDEPYGVLMLLRGYPNFLYEELSFSDTDKENFLTVEQGVLLSSVYEDMKRQEKYNDLVEDITDSLNDSDDND